MRSESVMVSAMMALALVGCARSNVHAGHGMEAASPSVARSGAGMSQMGTTTSSAAHIDADTARLRAATASFRSPDRENGISPLAPIAKRAALRSINRSTTGGPHGKSFIGDWQESGRRTGSSGATVGGSRCDLRQ